MSNPNFPTQAQNDAKYATPANISSAISAQAATDVGQYMSKVNNLSDVASAINARTNLGLATVAATGSYTDLLNKPILTQAGFATVPRIGWMTIAPGFIAAGTGMPSNGNLYWYPFWIGRAVWTADAFVIGVSTAQVGGAISLQAALYADDGTGWPDGNQQVVAPVSFILTATGTITSTFTASVALNPGLYWMMILFTSTSTPSTIPVISTLSNTTWSLPTPASSPFGVGIRGYLLTGQTNFPNSSLSPTSVVANGGSNIPVIAIRRSA